MTRLALLFTVVMTGSTLVVNAQCTPDPNSSGLISPSINEGLPNGMVDLAYEAIVTLNIPADTAYLGFSAEVDSAVLVSLTGLPNGFSYECNPSSCAFPGGSSGCVLISGFTDDPADAKTWDLAGEINFHINSGSNVFVLPYDIEDYTLTLEASNNVADINSEEARLEILPNPFTESGTWSFNAFGSGLTEIVIFNLIGAAVRSIPVSFTSGENQIEFRNHELEPGVYFASIQLGSDKLSTRFVITD